jgi:hypothetical protein
MADQSLLDQVMNNGLRDWFASLEQERTQTLADRNRHVVLAMITGFAVFIGAFLYTDEALFGVIAGVAVAIGGAAWANGASNKLAGNIKTSANEHIAAALDMFYAPHSGPNDDFQLAMDYGLIPASYDEIDYRDYWAKPSPDDAPPLKILEVEMQEWRQSGKSRHLVTVFQGVVMGYQFARPVASTTLVMRDMGIFNTFGAIGAKWGSNLERVRLVDPEFERAFEVFSSDQVEARYLVHPVFCERLVAMERAFHGKNLRLAFTLGRVVVAIEADDQFETGGIDSGGDEDRVAQTIAQIEALLTLAKTLNERPREVS